MSHFPTRGYNRGSGKSVVFETPQNYAELYNDYQFNHKNRKYGIWEKGDVKILEDDQFPDVDIDDKVTWENAIWGTRGKNGDEPLRYVLLKDCTIDHLYAIKDTQNVSHHMKLAINYWISKNCLKH